MKASVHRRIAAIGLIAAALAVGGPVAAAQAYTPPYNLVYTQDFSGATALSDCHTAGLAGQDYGSWDIFRCVQRTGYVELMAYTSNL
jgi:hypothetical protein